MEALKSEIESIKLQIQHLCNFAETNLQKSTPSSSSTQTDVISSAIQQVLEKSQDKEEKRKTCEGAPGAQGFNPGSRWPVHAARHHVPGPIRQCRNTIEETKSNAKSWLALPKARNFRKCLLASVPFQHLAMRRFGRYQSPSFLIRICVQGHFESTEPRDYILALTALADDPWISHIHVDHEKPVELVYQEALPVIRETLKQEEWLSISPDNTVAKRLAQRMGTSYDFERDVVNVDGVRPLVRLIRNPHDQESGERNRQTGIEGYISKASVSWVTKKKPTRGGKDNANGSMLLDLRQGVQLSHYLS
ncbi:hypothetical protein QBC45DRAFT_471892 [Copromyces sp. CBS 386.78]|nr:hypothetical protein QBC45DRAFT_471892 [Copromyces sp. CBS 386.78]